MEHNRDLSLGSATTEPHAESPFQQSPQPVDPLIQEREEFKAALLATHKLAKTPVSQVSVCKHCKFSPPQDAPNVIEGSIV